MVTFEGWVHVTCQRQHAESVKGELGSLSDLGTSFGHCAPSYTAAYNKTNTQIQIQKKKNYLSSAHLWTSVQGKVTHIKALRYKMYLYLHWHDSNTTDSICAVRCIL